MAEFGIENTRKASITFSLKSGDLVLVPGKNKVSAEKYEELKACPFFEHHSRPDVKEYPETSVDEEGTVVTKFVKYSVPSSLIDLGEIKAEADAKAKAAADEQARLDAEAKAREAAAKAEADAKKK